MIGFILWLLRGLSLHRPPTPTSCSFSVPWVHLLRWEEHSGKQEAANYVRSKCTDCATLSKGLLGMELS